MQTFQISDKYLKVTQGSLKGTFYSIKASEKRNLKMRKFSINSYQNKSATSSFQNQTQSLTCADLDCCQGAEEDEEEEEEVQAPQLTDGTAESVSLKPGLDCGIVLFCSENVSCEGLNKRCISAQL